MSAAKAFSFTARIKASQVGSGGAYVEFPYDVRESFGGKGRVKVVCTFEGIPYRGSLVKMGTPCHIIGMPKQIREDLGKDIGDSVRVTIREDLEERTVEAPPELERELAQDEGLRASYEKLSFTRRKELAAALTGAKREATRQERLRKILADLRRKR